MSFHSDLAWGYAGQRHSARRGDRSQLLLAQLKRSYNHYRSQRSYPYCKLYHLDVVQGQSLALGSYQFGQHVQNFSFHIKGVDNETEFQIRNITLARVQSEGCQGLAGLLLLAEFASLARSFHFIYQILQIFVPALLSFAKSTT